MYVYTCVLGNGTLWGPICCIKVLVSDHYFSDDNFYSVLCLMEPVTGISAFFFKLRLLTSCLWFYQMIAFPGCPRLEASKFLVSLLSCFISIAQYCLSGFGIPILEFPLFITCLCLRTVAIGDLLSFALRTWDHMIFTGWATVGTAWRSGWCCQEGHICRGPITTFVL